MRNEGMARDGLVPSGWPTGPIQRACFGAFALLGCGLLTLEPIG